jgi:TrmH family RNA methyltransferase
MKRLFIKEAKMIKTLSSTKGRKEHGLFAAEGIKAVSELLRSDIKTEFVVVDQDFNFEEFAAQNPNVKKVDQFSYPVSSVSSLKSAEGIIGIGKIPDSTLPEKFFEESRNLLGLFGISDPGNAGTLIRTACWFGLDGVVLFDHCADIYSPKVIRSSMGAVFHIRTIVFENFSDCGSLLSGFEKIGTFLDIKRSYISEPEKKKILFLGNESSGLDTGLKNVTDSNFRIDSKSGFDSLNVSVAGGIIMNEIFNI